LNSLQNLEIEVASSVLRLVVLLALTLAIAFFVASELSLVSAKRESIYRLTHQASSPKQAKAAELVLHAQDNLQHYLSVTQTGTTAGSLLLGWLGEGATVHWIEPWINWLPIGSLPAIVTAHSIAAVVAFLLVTYVEIVLGELIPKVLATNAPERTALLLIRPLQICSMVFWPLLVILNASVRLLTGGISRQKYQLELPSSSTPIVQSDPHTVTVSGVLELNTVNELLGLSLPHSSAYRTLAGFMIHHKGRVPAQGERLVWGELELEAASVVGDRLETVLLRQVTRPLFAPQAQAEPSYTVN
jgi:CBS domain containing-hemolysin-like protein